MRKFSHDKTKTGKYWTLFGKGNIDGLAMISDMMDFCIILLKTEWKVNQQEGGEFKCYIIWQMMTAMLHSNGQLRHTGMETWKHRERMSETAVQQKTTDYGEMVTLFP